MNNNLANNIDPLLPFKEEDIDELVRLLAEGKDIYVDRSSKKALMGLAQTFLEEILDLNSWEKQNPSVQAIARQIGIKFPEVGKDQITFTADRAKRRTNYIDREE